MSKEEEGKKKKKNFSSTSFFTYILQALTRPVLQGVASPPFPAATLSTHFLNPKWGPNHQRLQAWFLHWNKCLLPATDPSGSLTKWKFKPPPRRSHVASAQTSTHLKANIWLHLVFVPLDFRELGGIIAPRSHLSFCDWWKAGKAQVWRSVVSCSETWMPKTQCHPCGALEIPNVILLTPPRNVLW